jgi:antagonist of KipI
LIRLLSSGFLTTIQDLGRPGFAHLGVSGSGAGDPISFRLANRLVGNPEAAPALEMTLRGGRFAFGERATIAVTGGDFECSVPMWRGVEVAPGQVVEIGGCRSGARCYLAVQGGFVSNYELGSASTHVLSGLGRVLQRGDSLEIRQDSTRSACERVVTLERRLGLVRVTPGSQTSSFDPLDVFGLFAGCWTVSQDSNRQGVRLSGPRLASPAGGLMLSEGVALGAIQVPPSGQPVILFVDSQTTGGYPVIANVASVDIGIVGQLRPGCAIRFVPITFDMARSLLFEQEEWIRGCV